MSFEALGLTSTDLHRFTQIILFLARSRRGDPFLNWMIGSSIAPEMLNYMDLDHATTILTQGVGLIS